MSRTPCSILATTACITLVSMTALSNASIGAPMIMHPDFDLPSSTTHATPQSTYQPTRVLLSSSQLVELRVQGVDIELLQSNSASPTTHQFSIDTNTAALQENSIAQLYESTNAINSSSSSVRFSVDRNTMLNDGDIAGNNGSLPGSDNSISTMTQSEGEYNFYDMQMEWKAGSKGPVDFSLSSGFTAIEANVSKQVNTGGTTQMYNVAHRVIAVPTIGSSVKWNISRDWSLTGKATTQSLNMGSSLIGFNAQSDWRISDRVGFVAGYQLLRSEFDLGAITTDLNQEGLFARLSIKF